MGSSKGGGYIKQDTLSPQQLTFLNQMLQSSGGQMNQAAGGYSQFLPGGGGGQAMTNQANQNFQQQTIPSIMNAFGSDSKGSSALNQALGAAGSNMNTDLASMLSQYQLQAAQGMGNLATSQAQMGTQTPQFAYMQKQMPMWLQGVLGGVGAASSAVGSYYGVKK